MKRTMQIIRAVVVLAVVTLCGAMFAGKPERPPAGMGKYLVVLWEPGTPVPGKQDERMKRVPEPDVEKLGGRVLAREANRRVIFLPYAALDQLRRHEAVSSVQRVWAGEPFSEWTEPAAVSGSRPGSIEGDSETFTWERAYTYDNDGNITHIGSDEFAYDDLGRITHSVVSGGAEAYFYDSFGNLTGLSRAGTAGSPVPVDPSSNRIVGEVYDAAGNVTTRKDGGKYVYDSLNMLVEYDLPTPYFSPRRILYDASDERIGVFISESFQRWTIRDFEGQILREFSSSWPHFPWSWEQDHIRGGGQLIAGETYQWGYYGGSSAFQYGGKRHYHLDHLGSVRVVTNAAGKAVAEHDFHPFGAPRTKQHQEQINYTGSPHIDGMRFAGHWRAFLGVPGVESDEYLDYMHARYYDPNAGRFLSVDPILGVPEIPQSWNRYAYARNNPLKFTDPAGLCIQDPNDSKPCTDMEITVTADAAEYTTWDTTKEFVDLMARDAATPMLNVMAGLYNDNPAQIGTGYGQQLAAAVPGGVVSGMTRTLGPAAGSNLIVNLGGTGEVAGANVVNVQAATIAGDTGVALRNAVDIARQSGQRVVMAHGDALPFQTGSVRTVVTNNVPVDRGTGYFGRSFTSSEIYRILAPLGRWIGSSAP